MPTGEEELGMTRFLTDTKGLGGRLKLEPEDFEVEEIPIPLEAKEGGQYTAATMRVRNWETNRLMEVLAWKLGIPRRDVSYAGTKDKRAVTTQQVVFKAPIDSLEALELNDVELRDLYPVARPLELGGLKGNRFHVTMRELALHGDEARNIAERVADAIDSAGGFPNYFGIQRFGANRPITHIVGKEMTKGNFQRAVELYAAMPAASESNEKAEWRKGLRESWDWQDAAAHVPKGLLFEGKVVGEMARSGDPAKALQGFPKNLLMMFTHAYQSYLFNRVLSARLDAGLGLNEPTLGDLFLPLDKRGLPDHRRPLEVTERNFGKVARRCREGKAFVSGAVFGTERILAGGEMGELERRVLEDEGVRAEDFLIPDIPVASSKGTRRELLAPVRDLQWELKEDALVLGFELNKGCYATCLLREFMKADRMDY